MGILHRATLTILLSLTFAGMAQAQSTTNPLRPAAKKVEPVATTSKAEEKAKEAPRDVAAPDKPKRARSPAQLANDNRMRLCGKEWRENKDKLKAQGKTWRTYNVECRARMKAAGQ
jgi:hypothetical protein